MNQKIHALIISLIVATSVVVAIDRSLPVEPQALEYDKQVTLSGSLTREYDMSYIDSDLSPMTDPDAVERAVIEARRKHPADKPALHAAIAHFILHLDKPIALRNGPADGLHPAAQEIVEIDLGSIPPAQFQLFADALGKTRFTIAGKLWHANTVHHLRAIMMEVVDIVPVK